MFSVDASTSCVEDGTRYIIDKLAFYYLIIYDTFIIMDIIEGMRTFVAVAQTGSFTGAAERLGISRALTSKYIGQLEQRFGLRLFNRTTRSVDMTDAGRAYMERCVRLLEDFDDLEAAVRDRQARPRGRIRISAPVAFGELFLPPLLSEFTGQYPEISVSLSLSDRYVNLVAEGFDIAVRIGELDDSGLIARRLTVARLLVCATPGYINRRGAPKHPADLSAHSCIVDDNLRSSRRWPFEINRKSDMIAVEGPIRVNSARAVRDFVLADKGIGLCPSFLVAEDIRSGRLKHLLKQFRTPEFGIHAVYPHRRHLASNVRALINFMAERFPPDWSGFATKPIIDSARIGPQA